MDWNLLPHTPAAVSLKYLTRDSKEFSQGMRWKHLIRTQVSGASAFPSCWSHSFIYSKALRSTEWSYLQHEIWRGEGWKGEEAKLPVHSNRANRLLTPPHPQGGHLTSPTCKFCRPVPPLPELLPEILFPSNYLLPYILQSSPVQSEELQRCVCVVKQACLQFRAQGIIPFMCNCAVRITHLCVHVEALVNEFFNCSELFCLFSLRWVRMRYISTTCILFVLLITDVLYFPFNS